MKRKPMSLTAKHAWTGRLFVIPFVLGFLFFFLQPMIQSIRFVFSEVSIDISRYDLKPAGLSNLRVVFLEDADFTTNLAGTIVQLLWQVPVILILSIFFAIILNRKFFARVLVRAVFFLPVIIASGVIISIIRNDVVAGNAMAGNIVSGGNISQSTALRNLLVDSGFSAEIVSLTTKISDNLFSMVWKTGIQMIIFLAGLQSISPALYEASAIEGATAWEDFWQITIPMIGPIIFMNTVYTLVDFFTDANNKVMQQVLNNANALKLGWSAAMSWSYFALIALILGALTFGYSRVARSDG